MYFYCKSGWVFRRPCANVEPCYIFADCATKRGFRLFSAH